MCVFAKSYSIPGMIVTTISELVNVCGVYNATAIYGHEAVMGKRAGIIISWHDGQAEASFSSTFAGRFEKSGIFSDKCLWRYG